MFGPGIPLFRLFGIPVKLDWSWFIAVALIAWSLGNPRGAFPLYALEFGIGRLSPLGGWVLGVAGALGLFASVLAHEFGHSLVAQRLGLPIRGITLFIFGGVAELSREPRRPRDEFWVAVAGPAVSVALGVLGLAAAWVLPRGPAWLVIGYLGVLNLGLVVFNMIPAFPLDGGRVLRSALWAARGDMLWATRVAARIGAGFGTALLVLAGVQAFYVGLSEAVWTALMGLFLRGAANATLAQAKARSAAEGRGDARGEGAEPGVPF